MNNKKGFTLIELLVVISIIGMLSSVVLNSLNAARDKSNNVHINSTVMAYVNALNMYYNDFGHYPNVPWGVEVCLDVEPCYATSIDDVTYDMAPWALDAGLTSALAPYFPGGIPKAYEYPVHRYFPTLYSKTYGVHYRCYSMTGDCKTVHLQWDIPRKNPICPFGAVTFPTFLSYARRCTLMLNGS